MDVFGKANILGDAARFDVCTPKHLGGGSETPESIERWIYPAVLPSGKIAPLFKTLMTNACENDCAYCANNCKKDFPRYSFQPEELAKLFMQLFRRGEVSGLFLSSAIRESAKATMEQMIKAVEILRYKYHFCGYIHLKILPEAKYEHIERAIQLADRVSINLEAPNQEMLRRISGSKNFDELLLRMEWIKEIVLKGGDLPAGHTTQFVVGAADESDREILQTVGQLYQRLSLRRAYFSAFSPVKGTLLESHPATPLVRERRLYQADFLFRQYGFGFDEMVYDAEENLLVDVDPKLAWAQSNPERFPVEINNASKEELLRIPGIGPQSAQRIVEHRAKNRFYSLEELKGLGIKVKRAALFILISGLPVRCTQTGKSPEPACAVSTADRPLQLELW